MALRNRRAQLFQVRLSPTERSMLSELANRDGLSQSEWFRFQLRTLHAAKRSERMVRAASG